MAFCFGRRCCFIAIENLNLPPLIIDILTNKINYVAKARLVLQYLTHLELGELKDSIAVRALFLARTVAQYSKFIMLMCISVISPYKVCKMLLFLSVLRL